MTAPCLKCGAATPSRVEFTGLLSGEVFACDACLDAALSEHLLHGPRCPRAEADRLCTCQDPLTYEVRA